MDSSRRHQKLLLMELQNFVMEVNQGKYERSDRDYAVKNSVEELKKRIVRHVLANQRT